MNKLKKMLVKNDFLKAVEGYSAYWRDLSLYSFQDSVSRLNKKIEDEFALCLSYVLDCSVIVKPRLCDRERIVFIVDGVHHELYELKNGKVKPMGKTENLSLVRKLSELEDSFRVMSDAYLELMSEYKTEVIKITERVNFCYDFYDGYYFTLKDKKDASRETKIYVIVNKDSNEENDSYCIDWKDLELLNEEFRIDPDYKTNINMVEFHLDGIMKRVKKKLGIAKTKEKTEDNKKIKSFVTRDADVVEDVPRLLIREDNLFTFVDGVKCVREEWRRHLRYLDLSNISFASVYIAGLDFTGSNAIIDSKLVYNGDISGCIFDSNNLINDGDCLDSCTTNESSKLIKR